MNLLKDAQLLHLLYKEDKGINSLSKPEKIHLHNTNLMYNLVMNPEEGNIRETFFFNQVSQVSEVYASVPADFYVDGRYTFELGGKQKKQKQIKNLSEAYIVKDNIEVGNDMHIPLWLFGFLY